MTFTTFIEQYWFFLVMVVVAITLIVLSYVIFNAVSAAKDRALEAAKKPKVIVEPQTVPVLVESPKIENEPIKVDAPVQSETKPVIEAVKITEPSVIAPQPIKEVALTQPKETPLKKAPNPIQPLKPIDEDHDLDELEDEPTAEERAAELLITGKVQPIILPTVSKSKVVVTNVGEEAPKPKRKVPPKYHVLYRAIDNKWYVKKEGSDSIIRVLETQREAVSVATIRALSQNSAIVVHTKEGKIRKQTSLKEAMDPEEDE